MKKHICRKTHKSLLKAMSVFTALILAFMAAAEEIGADTNQDILDARNRISDYENAIEEVDGILEEIEADASDVDAYIKEMDSLSVELNSHLHELAEEKENTSAEITELEKKKETQSEQCAEQYEAMKLRIRYMYEFGNVSILDILMGTGSVTEFFNQVTYVAEVNRYDREKLNQYQQTLADLEETEAALLENYAALEREEAEYEENLTAVEQVLDTKNAELTELYGQMEEQEAALADYREDIENENANIAYLEYQLELEAEAARQAAIQAAEEYARAQAEEAARIAESESIAESIAESESVEQSIAESIAAEEQEETIATGEDSSSENGDAAEETAEASHEGTTATDSSQSSTMTSGNLLLTWPCPGYQTITSTFGPRPEAPVEGVSLYHNAIDIAAPLGADIVAAADGVVIYAGDGEEVASTAGGYQVWVSHNNGEYITMYMHCSYLKAQKGDLVQAGEKLAEVGNTGLSAGYHLDFRILYGTTYIDPLGDNISYRY